MKMVFIYRNDLHGSRKFSAVTAEKQGRVLPLSREYSRAYSATKRMISEHRKLFDRLK